MEKVFRNLTQEATACCGASLLELLQCDYNNSYPAGAFQHTDLDRSFGSSWPVHEPLVNWWYGGLNIQLISHRITIMRVHFFGLLAFFLVISNTSSSVVGSRLSLVASFLATFLLT